MSNINKMLLKKNNFKMPLSGFLLVFVTSLVKLKYYIFFLYCYLSLCGVCEGILNFISAQIRIYVIYC